MEYQSWFDCKHIVSCKVLNVPNSKRFHGFQKYRDSMMCLHMMLSSAQLTMCLQPAYSIYQRSVYPLQANFRMFVFGEHFPERWTHNDLEESYHLRGRCRAFSWRELMQVDKYERRLFRLVVLASPKVLFKNGVLSPPSSLRRFLKLPGVVEQKRGVDVVET